MTVKLNLPAIAAVLAAVAGIAGSALTPLFGTQLAIAVQAVLQAVSGLLVVIPTYHVASVAAAQSKLKAVKAGAGAPLPQVQIHV